MKRTEPIALPKHRSLEATIALVTAMYEQLEAGEPFTNAQLAAARHDGVLGVLFYRFSDYVVYSGRLHCYASEDTRSIALEAHMNEYFSQQGGERLIAFLDQNLREALTPSPAVLRWRRRQRRKQKAAA